MRSPRWWVGVAASAVLVVSGCTSSPSPGPTATGAAPTGSVAGSQPVKPQVTVPDLGGTATGDTPAPTSDSTSAVSPADPVPTADSTPTGDATTAAPAATPTVITPVAPVVNCGGCTVLGTSSDLPDGLTAALTTSNGRATLLAVGATGTVAGAANVPYGVSFPAPADGRLACAGGLCVVVATTTDASAVLSAFAWESGAWTDLSGDNGFLSATQQGMAVPVDGSLGVAIQISDGTTTVWTVLVRSGTSFTTLGCAPDAATPDLGSLSTAGCLS